MSKPGGRLLALVLLLLPTGCGGVTYYENKVHPERDLERDKKECSTDAYSKAIMEVPYNDPAASSKRAMVQQNEFMLCMRSRGWTELKERKGGAGS